MADRLGGHLARSRPAAAAFVGAVVAGLAPRAARAASWGLTAAVGAALVAAIAVFAVTEVDPPRIDADVAAEARPPVRLASLETAAPAAPVRPVSDRVVHAFLAAEDARFFEHGAIDPWAMGRAAWNDLTGEGALQGGSTITQQLAKHSLAERGVPWGLRRKAAEVVEAFALERRLSKDAILQRYLEAVYFGERARGLTEAARVYFDRPVEALELSEVALLAALPACPVDCGPRSAPEAARARRDRVLDRMAAEGWATPEEVLVAKEAPLP